ncbi:MAG: phosphomannomutase/phosphoglucomutase [Patescibacteria group bacterium]|nr:phosphomannomutase/phosphoglucomutase [Patescibacteria group bacterium]MDE2589160.1 phosphomannomutase/phosphoglucomutase [Patescibacteria group bacterium]
MNIDPKIFKAYDIRGIYPQEINEENITAIVAAIYTFFLDDSESDKPLRIALGRDMRLSSPVLFEKAMETLVSMGAHVLDVGLVSTPSFYFSVYHYNVDAGIQITASHNPKEYNGIKFVKKGQNGLVKIGKSTGMDSVMKMAIEGVHYSAKSKGTVTKQEHVLDDEVTNALKVLGNPQIKEFTIAADPANAMGATYIEALFKRVPGNLIKMNFELDGSFPAHQPDPLDFKNLVDLQKKVIDEKADFGLAPDGDGDRLFFIDEKGQVVPATIITALVSRELLKENPGAMILFDIRYIFTPIKIVEEFGGKYEVTRVGHAFITETMNRTGAIFAGESSAHYYYKSNGNAESQLATIISVLKVLTEEGKTLSQVADELRRSFESGEFNFRVTNAQEILQALKQKYEKGRLDTLDGVAINYPDWRFSVRTSNTEPLLRLNVESYDKQTMEKMRDELIQVIDSLAKK